MKPTMLQYVNVSTCQVTLQQVSDKLAWFSSILRITLMVLERARNLSTTPGVTIISRYLQAQVGISWCLCAVLKHCQGT